MAERPTIAPDVLATLTDGAPKRIVRKLDKSPEQSEAWAWKVTEAGATVTTDRGETVSLSAPVLTTVEQVHCTCLLAPRCLHVLAVVSRLEVSAAAEESLGAPESSNGDPGELRCEESVAPARAAAASALWRAAADVLLVGATASGALPQAELLRAVHACRVAGLHRASAAGVRVVRAVRNLRGDRPEFRLDTLAADLREVLTTTQLLRTRKSVDASVVGTARRQYTAAGNLRLYGLFSEPVVAASGYAGVSTYLCDDEQRLYTVSDVLPGDADDARSAYRAGSFAGASVGHHALGRGGLFVNGATASADGRLGRGHAVKAVTAAGVRWDEEPLSKLWQEPLAAQLDRHRRFSAQPPSARPAGYNLLFVDATVAGASDRALLLQMENLHLWGISPNDHEALHYRHNLASLGAHPGLSLRVIGRLRLDAACTMDLLSIAADGLSLPDAWGDRLNLGFDVLAGANLPAGGTRSGAAHGLAPVSELPDPLAPLRRRLRRVAIGGRATLPPEALREIEREVAGLRRRMMPTAATLLSTLAAAANEVERNMSGQRQRMGEPFATAWLRASLYESAATAELARATWM